MKLDLSKITDIKVDGIDMKDYPDFCDAYISEAYYPAVENPRPGFPGDWRELTEEELDHLNTKETGFTYQKIWDYLF